MGFYWEGVLANGTFKDGELTSNRRICYSGSYEKSDLQQLPH